MIQQRDDIKEFLRVGDPVRYQGEPYWIVRGPAVGPEGTTFRISRIPPEITVDERDLQLEHGTRALRG